MIILTKELKVMNKKKHYEDHVVGAPFSPKRLDFVLKKWFTPAPADSCPHCEGAEDRYFSQDYRCCCCFRWIRKP